MIHWIKWFLISAEIKSSGGSRKWHLIQYHLADDGQFDENSATAYMSPEDFLFDLNPIRFTFTELETFIAPSFDPRHDPYDL